MKLPEHFKRASWLRNLVREEKELLEEHIADKPEVITKYNAVLYSMDEILRIFKDGQGRTPSGSQAGNIS